MADKFNIELDDSFVSKLYDITDAVPPAIADVNLVNLKKQLYEVGLLVQHLKTELEEIKANPKKKSNSSNSNQNQQASVSIGQDNTTSSQSIDLSEFAGAVTNVQKASEFAQLGLSVNYGQPTLQFIDPSDVKRTKKQYFDENGQPVKGKVLVIDDLGIITYQLSVILKRAGYLPVTSKEIYDAIDKFKRSSFDYVIMDLFIPTEREGFILLEELRKISIARGEEPIIAVMSASTRKDYKQVCHKKGAVCFVEKLDDWQKELFALLLQYN